MKLIYLKSALKCDSFDVAIDVKIQFFRVLVTIEPGRSLLQFVTTNCLIIIIIFFLGTSYVRVRRINFREGSFSWKSEVLMLFLRVESNRRETTHPTLFSSKYIR